jgi:hypothetical protein
MCGAGEGNQDARIDGAHSSWFKSTITNHGDKRAALLYPVIFSRRWDLPFLPYTNPGNASTCFNKAENTASSTLPSTAPETTGLLKVVFILLEPVHQKG